MKKQLILIAVLGIFYSTSLAQYQIQQAPQSCKTLVSNDWNYTRTPASASIFARAISKEL